MSETRAERQPALCLLAEAICIYGMTTGFCSPRNNHACGCWQRAEEMMRGSGMSAAACVWVLQNRRRIEQEATSR